MPSSLVETRPLESLVFPSQQPGQDSSDSHRAATSTNKCLFSTHQCTLVKVEKLAMSGWKEWSVNSCYTFCLFVSFLLGALERKRRKVGNGNMFLNIGYRAVCVCLFVCVWKMGDAVVRACFREYVSMDVWSFVTSLGCCFVVQVWFYDKNEISRSGMKHGISMM